MRHRVNPRCQRGQESPLDVDTEKAPQNEQLEDQHSHLRNLQTTHWNRRILDQTLKEILDYSFTTNLLELRNSLALSHLPNLATQLTVIPGKVLLIVIGTSVVNPKHTLQSLVDVNITNRGTCITLARLALRNSIGC